MQSEAMRFLTEEQGNEVSEAVWGIPLSRVSAHAGSIPSAAYVLPTDSGVKTAISKQLSQVASFPCCLWINEHGIWPSCENLQLFETVRKGLGELRSLDITPFHVFECGEESHLSSLLSLVLYFVWGAVLLEPTSLRIWVFSHDEWVSVSGVEEASLLTPRSLFSKFGLKRIPD